MLFSPLPFADQARRDIQVSRKDRLAGLLSFAQGANLPRSHRLNRRQGWLPPFVNAGIFVSYTGLFSYYNFDNWTYQPSFVSSNTPWFFNGLRIQYFPTA